MRFSSEQLQCLLRQYLTDLSPASFTALAEASEDACHILLRAYCKKIMLRLSKDEQREVCQDAVSRMLTVYLKNPKHGEIPIKGRLFHEIRYRLHNPKEQRYEKRTGDLPVTLAAPTVEPAEQEDPMTYVQSIALDKEVDGRRVVVDLFSSRYYRSAIKRIARYAPKAWIYRNAVKLNTIFKLTRGEA